MANERTRKRAVQDKKQGKAPSTQAGEYVREQMDRLHAGKEGVKNPKQAIAIGLSEARRDGVEIPPPPGASRASKKVVTNKPAKKKATAKTSNVRKK